MTIINNQLSPIEMQRVKHNNKFYLLCAASFMKVPLNYVYSYTKKNEFVLIDMFDEAYGKGAYDNNPEVDLDFLESYDRTLILNFKEWKYPTTKVFDLNLEEIPFDLFGINAASAITRTDALPILIPFLNYITLDMDIILDLATFEKAIASRYEEQRNNIWRALIYHSEEYIFSETPYKDCVIAFKKDFYEIVGGEKFYWAYEDELSDNNKQIKFTQDEMNASHKKE